MINEVRSQRTILAVLLFTTFPFATIARTDARLRLGTGGAARLALMNAPHSGALVVAQELPSTGCSITLNGDYTDWTPTCVGNNLWFPGSAPTGTPTISAARLAVSHYAHPNGGPPFDTLYVYIGITGDNSTANLAQDNVILMLDTRHDGQMGSTGD